MPDPATVNPEAAATLDAPVTSARTGRLVRRALRPSSIARLFEVMDAVSDEARRRGLTEEILEQELAAHNAERRGPTL